MINKPRLLVTGAAGFIGSHCMREAIIRGYDVLGVDNLNNYYDPKLKNDRLRFVGEVGQFEFEEIDISDYGRFAKTTRSYRPNYVLHLAAQAGVRYSIERPFEYAKSNLVGHLSVLESVRACDSVKHLVYASSSSVYGDRNSVPFSEDEPADSPASLYAATKRSDELMSFSYHHLYGIRATGLRFFTVYGPWGRPDMAYWIFVDSILKNKPIKLFNRGNMVRDFTYIGDIVDYVFKIIQADKTVHNVYNIGGSSAQQLKYFLAIIERACGREAIIEYDDMQPGDVKRTAASNRRLIDEFGDRKMTPIEEGIPAFVEWFKAYFKAAPTN
ncbi:NAD-dependent epimerase/dehydratase family protein [Hyphobacterium sp. HN65]|uniref:NAD-dependent epimerase/dehydratase family protein n=2 Tax=Hyphobacterium lacteum TaxID=3116575 RepID=A0ABU7LPR0_9PROT|nr:NAD-dependent epimerase/dehydratase family protein [Hyphobacterium sp. HN65]